MADDDPTFQGPLEDEGFFATRKRVLAKFERRYLIWLLERANGNMSGAARIAGIQRTTLYRLIEKHGLRRELVVSGFDEDVMRTVELKLGLPAASAPMRDFTESK